MIDLLSHFLDLLLRETLSSSGANHQTVPYPRKEVLWASLTVSTEHVSKVAVDKVVQFIFFTRFDDHLL